MHDLKENEMRDSVAESRENITKVSKKYRKREKQCERLVEKQKQAVDRYNQLKIGKSYANIHY